MKASALLRRAKALLSEGEVHHVCNALEQVAHEMEYFEGVMVYEDVERVLEYIDRALGPSCATLSQWMRLYHPECYKLMLPDDYTETRLRWMDWMIKQYQMKDD